jgi:hypothetical protein
VASQREEDQDREKNFMQVNGSEVHVQEIMPVEIYTFSIRKATFFIRNISRGRPLFVSGIPGDLWPGTNRF